MRRGVRQMASDCAVPSSSSLSSSSSSFSAEQPESPPGCQTLEWVVSRHTPPSSLGKLGAWQLPEAAAAARARLVSATAVCPKLAGTHAAGSLGWSAWMEETAAPTRGAPSAQTFLARQPPLSLLPGRRGNLEPKPWL